MSESKLLKNEFFQREMIELEDCFSELGYVYDNLAEKLADLRIRLEEDTGEVEYSTAEREGWLN
tara:strand:- start:939 stop:1130 length:192 start_codon:yes stop_codon:yes gene_type:complete